MNGCTTEGRDELNIAIVFLSNSLFEIGSWWAHSLSTFLPVEYSSKNGVEFDDILHLVK